MYMHINTLLMLKKERMANIYILNLYVLYIYNQSELLVYTMQSITTFIFI